MKISSKLQKFIMALFYALAILVPLAFTDQTLELFEFPKMIITYSLSTLILGAWILRMVIEKRIILRRTKFDLLIYFFIISQILSSIFSMHLHTSLFGYYTRFHQGLTATIVYAILYFAFVSNAQKKQVLKFLFINIITLLITAIYAIPEHYGHSPSCLILTNQFNVGCWVQNVQKRVFATFGQPNWLAAYFITLIPVALSLFIIENNKKKPSLNKKLIYLVATSAAYLALIFTQSRSGIIGLAVGLIFYFIYLILELKNYKKNRKQRIKNISIIVSIFIIISLLFGTTYSPSLLDIYNKITNSKSEQQISEATLLSDQTGRSDTAQIRQVVWRGAIDVWKRYPILGSGVETFGYSYYKDRPMEHNSIVEWDFLYSKAHNELLNYLSTTGIVGLTAYLSLIGGFMLLCMRQLRLLLNEKKKNKQLTYKDETRKLLILAILSGSIALLISNTLGFSTIMVTILQYTFFAIYVLLNSEKDNKVNDPVYNRFNFKHYAIITTLCLLIGFIQIKIFQVYQADKLAAAAQKKSKGKHFNPQSIELMKQAINLNPRQALFYDKLGTIYTRQAVALMNQPDMKQQAIEAAKQAIIHHEMALKLNSVQLNFYKSLANDLIVLSKYNPELLFQAQKALDEASNRAPTDSKVVFYQALVNYTIYRVNEKDFYLDKAIEKFQKALTMKPDYHQVKYELAKAYLYTNQLDKAYQLYEELEKVYPNNQEIKQNLELIQASISTATSQ